MTDSDKEMKKPVDAVSAQVEKQPASSSEVEGRDVQDSTGRTGDQPSNAIERNLQVKKTDIREQDTMNSAKNDQQPRSSGKAISVFAILLSLAALGGSGFTWYESQVANMAEDTNLAVGVANIGGSIKLLGSNVASIKAQQSNLVSQETLTTRLLEASTAVDSTVRDLKDDQKELLSAVNKINTDLSKGINEFVVDEVSQLLKFANNSAVFSADAAGAIKALTLADTQLKELANPRYAEVRRKITQEITKLEGIEPIDVESISSRLAAVAQKVPSLPLENEPPQFGSVSAVEQVADTEEVTWKTELGKVWRDMLSAVQIQRVDQPPKPLLAPQQRYFLNQNLQLNLAKAELALLQNRQGVYIRSIDASLDWLNDYFDLDDKSVQLIMSDLNVLKSKPISVELPSVAESYNLLQSIKGGLN